jgi:hypothetical protein
VAARTIDRNVRARSEAGSVMSFLMGVRPEKGAQFR